MRQGHGHDPSQFGFKAGDRASNVLECRSIDNLVALSTDGRTYTVPVSSLPSARGDGQPITSMVDVAHGARIVHMVAGADDSRYVLGSTSGYGFIATLKDMHTRQRAGKQFMTVADGDILLAPIALHGTDDCLAMLSGKGRMLVLALSEVKALSGGGRGTILMGLDDADSVAQWVAVGPAGLATRGLYRNKETQVVLEGAELAQYIGKRARKGKLLSVKVKQPLLTRLESL